MKFPLSAWIFAGLCLAVFVAIICLAIYCCKNVDEFADMGGMDYPQPLKFIRQELSVPGNCKPFMNCFFPSQKSNSISLTKEGNRYKLPTEDEELKWCEISWRDCPAYRDCVNGKCIPKKYPKLF